MVVNMKNTGLVALAVVVGALVVLSPIYVPAIQHVISPQPTPQVQQTQQPQGQQEASAPVYVNSSGSVNDTALSQEINSIPAGELSDSEKKDLLFMREEEKLARDVYLTLYKIWGAQIFANIARSEQTHTDAVKMLLEKYGLPDPAAGKGIGEFTNPELQELYNKLVEEGSKSLVDALKVGALIEEKDIIDLKKAINETDNPDIKLVYENLMRGSRNHLRAFVRMLAQQGVEYKPQLLSMEEYNEIISSPWETGMGGQGGGHGRGGRHGQNNNGWLLPAAPLPIST